MPETDRSIGAEAALTGAHPQPGVPADVVNGPGLSLDDSALDLFPGRQFALAHQLAVSGLVFDAGQRRCQPVVVGRLGVGN